MLSLLDETDSRSSKKSLSVSTDHKSFITALLPSSNISHPIFVSSCLDGTCKLWDLVKGTLLRNWCFPQPITAAVVDPAERFLFCGSADGRIFMTPFDIGLITVDSDYIKIELNGHRKSITALTFSSFGLISASEDCTACLWDIIEGVIIRRFYHKKSYVYAGFITNMIVIPNSSLSNYQKKSTHFPVSSLQKQSDPLKDTITLLPSTEEQQITHQYQTANLLNKQILDLEVGRTPEALQLKVETNIVNRLWISDMTKHVIEMNDHLRSRLLDLNEHRSLLEETDAKTNKNL